MVYIWTHTCPARWFEGLARFLALWLLTTEVPAARCIEHFMEMPADDGLTTVRKRNSGQASLCFHDNLQYFIEQSLSILYLQVKRSTVTLRF